MWIASLVVIEVLCCSFRMSGDITWDSVLKICSLCQGQSFSHLESLNREGMKVLDQTPGASVCKSLSN